MASLTPIKVNCIKCIAHLQHCKDVIQTTNPVFVMVLQFNLGQSGGLNIETHLKEAWREGLNEVEITSVRQTTRMQKNKLTNCSYKQRKENICNAFHLQLWAECFKWSFRLLCSLLFEKSKRKGRDVRHLNKIY